MGDFQLEQTPLVDESSKIINASEIRVGSGEDAAFRATPDGVNISGLGQGSMLNIQGWAFAGTFSASDSDTVAWTTGALTFGDGSSYTISAGNTGNMSALTYIYFDRLVSETVLQTTTTAATSVGANKVLVGVAKNETAKNATFQAFGGKGVGTLITADNIAANTVTSNEITTNALTGLLVQGSTVRTAASGSRVVMDTNGIYGINAAGDAVFLMAVASYLGYDAGDLLIGSASKYLFWDNSAGTLTIRGTLNADDITAGTITGRTFKATGGTTGIDIWIQNDGEMLFRYNNATKSYMKCDTNSQLVMDSDNNILLKADSIDTYYDEDNGDTPCHWRSYGDNLRMKLDSDGNLRIDGAYSDDGADYAEYFESADGKAIPTGTSVVLEGDKIRKAKKGEEPIGVISARPTIIGNAGGTNAGEEWAGKYIKDEFGEYVMEKADFWTLRKERDEHKELEKHNGWCDEVPAPKGAKIIKRERRTINPEWISGQEYIPRVERPEWNVVGLMGQIPVLKNQIAGSRWIKMKELNSNVDLYLVR